MQREAEEIARRYELQVQRAHHVAFLSSLGTMSPEADLSERANRDGAAEEGLLSFPPPFLTSS
jgi:hypothetical protein